MSRRFRIGLSYSRATLEFVQVVAGTLAAAIGRDSILFDKFHEAEFARPNLALSLPLLYKDECDLVVALLDETYHERDWTGLEWAAIYAIRKRRESHRVMLLSVGRHPPTNLSELDGTLDVSGRSGNDVAVLILERLAINEGQSRDHYLVHLSAAAAGGPALVRVAPSIEDQLRDQLHFCRRDRDYKSRRRAIASLATAVEKLPIAKPSALELRLAIWRQALLEARHYAEYLHALSGLQSAFEVALSASLPRTERWELLRIISEAAVDISQTAPGAIELNKIVLYLNSSIKQIGQILGLQPVQDHSAERLAELLATRSKCRRALASVLNRRAQRSRETEQRTRTLRREALEDAERAQALHECEFTLHEHALSLFAVSSSPSSANATAGLEILARLASEPGNVVASYEYVRQLKLRHRYLDAMNAFSPLSGNDTDRRRFAANLTYFVGAVLGLYYEGSASLAVEEAATDAITWLQEAIAAGHHRAREIVDYCFLLAITGSSIDQFAAPLSEVTDHGRVDWSVVGELSFHASRGEETLREALLLGLEDALLWNRIGTLHLDFSHDLVKAVAFYDQAIRLDPHSPIYHFNRAKALAGNSETLAAARRSLMQARRQAKNMWGWFTVNQRSFDELQRSIESGLNGDAPWSAGSET